MHSMYEPSFNYIASIIKEYFSTATPAEGARFHVQFEKKEDVESLFEALSAKSSEELIFNDYHAAVLSSSGANVIIAASHNANEHFLTNLRNRTAEQKGNFWGKSLLIVHHTDLDSIVGGAESLGKETRPLHAASIRQKLSEDIGASSLQRHEKIVLIQTLSEMRETSYEDVSSIFSYVPFMNILYKGRMDLVDWNDLGLFPDTEIAAINTPKEITARLCENRKWYDTIQTINRYSANAEDDLEKYFSKVGVSELTSETWESNGFGKVAKWHADRESRNLPDYIGIETNLFDGEFEFWDRKEGETSAASKKRHIILFNPDRKKSVNFTLNFESTIRQGGVRIPANAGFAAEAKGKSLTVCSEGCDGGSVIGQITYDDPEASGKYFFNIAILPIAADCFRPHKSTYRVNGGARARRIQLFYEGFVVFNDSQSEETRVVVQQNDTITLTPCEKLVLTLDEDADEDRLCFNLTSAGITIPCEIYRESTKPTRITGVRIWKWKREAQKSFEYAGDNKLILGNEEFFTHRTRTKDFLDLESALINKYPNDCHWIHGKSGLQPKHLTISEKLRDAFKDIIDYYRKTSLLPSLACITPELEGLMQRYVSEYQAELSAIDEGIHLPETKHNLMRIGTIEHSDGERQVYLTPLHPLNVAYQLEFFAEAGKSKIPEEILKCLSPASLLPYINDPSDSSYKLQPVPETELPEWVVYKPCNTLSRGWHNEYVQKLIAEKIEEYTRHFPYLFTGSSKAPVRINLVHMGDCIDALKGIVRYFQRALDKNDGDGTRINPICLCIYGDHGHCNKFEEFARYSDPKAILRVFEINLETQKKIDANEVLTLLQDKLQFFLKPVNETPDYAHMTFFRFDQNAIEWTYQTIETVKTGTALGGIVNAVPSVFRGQEYLTGFGGRHLPPSRSKLITLAHSLNALARVASTHDPYSKNEAIFSALKEGQKTQLEQVYDSSNWVTLIDPKVDLNFFKMHETAKDLVIIHYSDQYNNSSGYDAITVTRKSHQYQAILHEFLTNRELTPSVEDELRLINMFNAINGDWLLQLIAGRAHFPREKISILSAVKTMLAFLSHPNIVWVPLSLEEVLRVSGSVGLRQSEGLFSVKNLGEKGSYCDDLLMAGVERKNGEVIVHLYPIEVKIGNNGTSVIEKAKSQGLHTAETLKAFLNSEKTDFTSKFYRNFFAKLILAGAEKMDLYDILPSVNWESITDLNRAELLNDDYRISWDLKSILGSAAVLSFQNDWHLRTAKVEHEILVLRLPESDGYINLLENVERLEEIYRDPESSIEQKLLLSNRAELMGIDKQTNKGSKNEPIAEVGELKKTPSAESDKSIPTPNTEGMKILFGHDVNYKHPVFWFPNDTDRVMHTNTGIIGTMGTGKTQFTKSMVTQLVRESKNNVNGTSLGFLIFDYKGDYIKEDFLKATGAKRLDLHRLPYNPLSLTVTSKAQPMLPLHTANAIKESIATAFHLGTVQKQRLRDVIMEAYEAAGIDKSNKDTWTKPAPTLSDVCNLYLRAEDVKSDSLYAAFDNLHQFEIFESDSSKTMSLFDLLRDPVIINLSGYDPDIQNLVVAITLDQFYSQMQKAGHSTIQGNLREIQKMILVDEADNFLSQNFASIRKILKEGREFGVGTILSTQFLNHFSTSDNEYSNYILSWIVHRVSEINPKDVGALFGLQDKGAVAEMVSSIKGLNKHCSVVNTGHGDPVYIRDRAFWEIL